MSIDAHIRHEVGAFRLDVSFRIHEPGITALFGPSGAGKTTTVNALAGLFRPRQGRIAIEGRTVLDTSKGIFVPPRHRRVGYVFQDARLFPHMTVLDNLRFGWRRSAHRDAESFAGIVEMLGLEALLARKPIGLSGGERSRVALGRALLGDPMFLLLDEPLAALDAPRRGEILPYLERLRDEARIPMVYVTHSVDELSRLADHVIVMGEGKVMREGRAFDLFSDLDFAELAGVPAYGAVLAVHVARQRKEESLTVLAFDGGELVVPRIERQVGAALRVRIHAEDVLLAREAPISISANNVLPATVTNVHAYDGVHADVQLVCGSTKLVARITKASQVRLAIMPGSPVLAILKSVTIDPRRASDDGPK